MAWPHAGTDWAPRLAAVESTYVALVAAIARFEPVVLCVADAAVRQRAEALLREANVDLDVRRVEIDYDDTWLRDSGPITLCGADGFVLADFRFTGWGGKFEGGRDDRLVEGLLARGLFVRATTGASTGRWKAARSSPTARVRCSPPGAACTSATPPVA